MIIKEGIINFVKKKNKSKNTKLKLNFPVMISIITSILLLFVTTLLYINNRKTTNFSFEPNIQLVSGPTAQLSGGKVIIAYDIKNVSKTSCQVLSCNLFDNPKGIDVNYAKKINDVIKKKGIQNEFFDLAPDEGKRKSFELFNASLDNKQFPFIIAVKFKNNFGSGLTLSLYKWPGTSLNKVNTEFPDLVEQKTFRNRDNIKF